VQSFLREPFPETTDPVLEPNPVVTEPIDPETRFYPCTRQLTCVGCA
jgi:hypothetical protein